MQKIYCVGGILLWLLLGISSRAEARPRACYVKYCNHNKSKCSGAIYIGKVGGFLVNKRKKCMELARKSNYVKHYIFKHHLYPKSTKWCGVEWRIHIQTHVQGKSGKRHSTLRLYAGGWSCKRKYTCPVKFGLVLRKRFRTRYAISYRLPGQQIPHYRYFYTCKKFALKMGRCRVKKSGLYINYPNNTKLYGARIYNQKLYVPCPKPILVQTKKVSSSWLIKSP